MRAAKGWIWITVEFKSGEFYGKGSEELVHLSTLWISSSTVTLTGGYESLEGRVRVQLARCPC